MRMFVLVAAIVLPGLLQAQTAVILAPASTSPAPLTIPEMDSTAQLNVASISTTSGLATMAFVSANSHQVFFEEFGAGDTWVQGTAPEVEGNAIVGFTSCQWVPPISNHLPGFLAAFLPWAKSVGAISASMFPTPALAACAPSYPDNPADPAYGAQVIATAVNSVLNHQYSGGYYALKSLITNQGASATGGALLTGLTERH